MVERTAKCHDEPGPAGRAPRIIPGLHTEGFTKRNFRYGRPVLKHPFRYYDHQSATPNSGKTGKSGIADF